MSKQTKTPTPEGEGFNADERAKARLAKPVIVDGVTYHPRRKTGRVVKEILRAAPTEQPDDDDVEGQIKGIESLYAQVAVLLRDDTGKNPDPVRLMGEAEDQTEDEGLDLEDARDLLSWLMPGERQAATTTD